LHRPSVSVVISTYQRADALAGTLAAMCASDYPDELVEILVVNNGSTDSTDAVIRECPRARGLWREHSGVSASRNHGAREAKGDLIMFLDDDIVVEPDNLRRHVELRDEYPGRECIVSGFSSFPADLRAELERTPLGRFRMTVEDVSQDHHVRRWGSDGRVFPDAVPTQNLSIRREFFQMLGGFDERFPSIGGEDLDLCIRAGKTGALVVMDYGIRLTHNDQHRDLMAICRREERGAVGHVCVARKHPELAPPALSLNGPVHRGDPPRLIARKLSRSILSSPVGLAGLHRLIGLTERLRPRGGWPLETLYRAAVGLHVFRGVRRGLLLTSREPWDPALRRI
jgi:GT2 family glycosyltransferase